MAKSRHDVLKWITAPVWFVPWFIYVNLVAAGRKKRNDKKLAKPSPEQNPSHNKDDAHDDRHAKKDDHGHGHGKAWLGPLLAFLLFVGGVGLFDMVVYHQLTPDFHVYAFGNPPPGTYSTRTVTQTETVSRQAVPNASATVTDCSVYHDTVTLPANGDWTGPNPVYARCKPKLSISDADSIMDIEYLDLQGHWVGKDVQYVYDGRVINGVPKDYTALRFRRKCTLKGSDGTPDSTEVNLCRAPLDSQQPPEPITFSINFIPYDTA